MTPLTFRRPEDVIDAYAEGCLSRDEIEFILNSPCFGLSRFEYIDCLLAADDQKANASHVHVHVNSLAGRLG